MITNFKDFLNENESDDIEKRLLQRIGNAFKQIKYKKDIKEEPKGNIEKNVEQNKDNPKIINTPTNQNTSIERIPKFKSKPSLFGDKRLDDAYFGLLPLYGKNAVEDYLNNIELEPDLTTTDIVRYGMKYLSKK